MYIIFYVSRQIQLKKNAILFQTSLFLAQNLIHFLTCRLIITMTPQLALRERKKGTEESSRNDDGGDV